MQLNRFDNIQEFWHCTQAYLLQHQVENNVLLSILHTLLHNPERYLGKPYLAIVQTSSEILAVAIRTPPQKLILSKAQNMDALRLIAQDLRQEQLPGSMGLANEVEIFSQTWQRLTEQFYQRSVVMKIYQLTAVQRVSTARGYLRLATESDRSLLIEWLSAFLSETDQVVSFDLFSHHIARAIETPNDVRTLYLGVIVYNPSDRPATVNILQAASYVSQPDAPFVKLRIIVGWVERSETQPTRENVGFRSSTQPTHLRGFWR